MEDRDAWEKIRADETLRQHRYREVGACLVLYGQVLLALWDGQEQGKPGSSAEVVRMWREGISHDIYPRGLTNFGPAEHGPLYHVWAPRRGSPDTPLGGNPGECRAQFTFAPAPAPASFWLGLGKNLANAWQLFRQKRSLLHVLVGIAESARALVGGIRDLWFHARYKTPYGERPARELFQRTLHNLDYLNHSLANKTAAGLVAQAQKDMAGVDFNSLPARVAKMVLLRRAVADAAGEHQARLKWAVWLVFFAIGAGALFLHMYAHHVHIHLLELNHMPGLLWGGIVAVAVAWGIGAWVHYTHLEARYLDQRGLSEALRVQMYWAAAGLSFSVPASYLQRQRSELSWIRAGVRALSVPYQAGGEDFQRLTPAEQRQRLRTVFEQWIRKQRGYFDNEVRRYRARLFGYQQFGLFLALVGWLLGCWIILTDAVTPGEVLLIGLAASLLGGGLLIAYAENRHVSELAFNYDHMRHIYAAAEEHLERFLAAAGDSASAIPKPLLEKIQRLLFHLGQEALEENADWLVLHRARPFEPPVH